jgi:polyvinyl alcohol dehydrogenase (cytochrome)
MYLPEKYSMSSQFRRRLAGVSFLVAAALGSASSSWAGSSSDWLYAGGGLLNTRAAPNETKISPSTISGLKLKWSYTTAGDVSATPTIEGNDLYITDWGGYIHKVDRTTGAMVWKHKISDYTGNSKSLSRASPAIDASVVVIGDRAVGSGVVMGIDKNTGNLVWKTRLNTVNSTVITASPIIYNGLVYIGTSSLEEGKVVGKLINRGSMVALDVNTGKIVWQTYMTPEGYAGVSIWSSTPVVDVQRGSLYITTGNNHAVPSSVAKCINKTSDPAAQIACMAPDNYFDAVASLDLQTGKVKWSSTLNGTDIWYINCTLRLPSCQVLGGPDYDFGSGAMLINTVVAGKPTQLVGAGQKSGIFWALDPDTGKVVWSTQAGPGSPLGGIEWGSASDGARVYIASGNMYHKEFTLYGSNQKWLAGAWTALDAATGKFLWQVGQLGGGPRDGAEKLHSSISPPVTVANGVVFYGNADGTMAALDGATGKTLWTYLSGGTVNSGPAVIDGNVYWGSGYSQFGGNPNNQLYAFSVN